MDLVDLPPTSLSYSGARTLFSYAPRKEVFKHSDPFHWFILLGLIIVILYMIWDYQFKWQQQQTVVKKLEKFKR